MIGLAHVLFNLFACVPCGDTAWKVWDVCAVVVLAFFNDNQETIHGFSFMVNEPLSVP